MNNKNISVERSWAITDLNAPQLEHTWKIRGFSLVGLKIESPPFSAGQDDDGVEIWLSIGVFKSCRSDDPESIQLFLRRMGGSTGREKTTKPHFVNLRYSFEIPNCYTSAVKIKDARQCELLIGPELLTGGVSPTERVCKLSYTYDVLTIICRVSIEKGYKQYRSQRVIFPERDPDDELAKALGNLLKHGELSDVILCSGDCEIKAHRAILAARSPVFKAMFNHDLEETKTGRVELEDEEPAVIREMLEFIYTGKTSFQDKKQDDIMQLALRLYTAAEKFNIRGLKTVCVEWLSEHITSSTVGQVLEIASLFNACHLKEQALNFIKLNSIEILQQLADDGRLSKSLMTPQAVIQQKILVRCRPHR